MNNITIHKPHKIKNMLDTVSNKISNTFTIVVLYLANITKIKAIQRYADKLSIKKINRLKHQLIKDRWELDSLNKAINTIEKSTH
ncbi:MAG: hypothetical protein PUE69_00855 [Ruminococcus sp.]|nr:hypothetical protein [Ruminococcus sp.]